MDLNMSVRKSRNFGDECIDFYWTWTKADESIVQLKSLVIVSILVLCVHISSQIYSRNTSVFRIPTLCQACRGAETVSS